MKDDLEHINIKVILGEFFRAISESDMPKDPEWLSDNENKQAFLDAGYDWSYIV